MDFKSLTDFVWKIMKVYAFVVVVSHGINAPHSELYMYSKNGVAYLGGVITPEHRRMQIGDDIKAIVLDSPGGDILASLNIATQVAERQLPAIVGPNNECLSTCVLIHQASPFRVAAKNATFGFHSPDIVDGHNLSDEEYEDAVDSFRNIMASVLMAAGMEEDFIESWIYNHEMEIYTADELYEMGYIDEIIDPKNKKMKKREKSLDT